MEHRISIPNTLEENCMHLYVAAGRNNIQTPSAETMLYLSGIMGNYREGAANRGFVVGDLKEVDKIARRDLHFLDRNALPYLMSRCSGDFHMLFDSHAYPTVKSSELAPRFFERAIFYGERMGRESEPAILREINSDFEGCLKLLAVANKQAADPSFKITDKEYLDFYDAFTFALEEVRCGIVVPEHLKKVH